jgi:acyl carrier protein
VSEDIAQKVKEIVAERMGVEMDQITDETHFINDLNADSLDIAELVIDLEENFNIKISDEDAQQLETVGKAISYLKEHQEG